MPYINLPPVVSEMFWDLDRRIRALETAYRFNAPNVNFATNTPSNPRVADIFYDTNADQLKYWDGTQWVVIADNSFGVPLNSFTSTWSGTGLTYTGTPATGKWMRVGKQISFYIQVNCTTVTNFGTGAYSLTLPTGLTPNMHAVVAGGLHDASTNGHLNLIADIEPASLTMELYYSTSNGVNDRMTHNKPLTLATADYFYFSGSYYLA